MSQLEPRLYRTPYFVLPRQAIEAMLIDWQTCLEALLVEADWAGMETPDYHVLRSDPGYTSGVQGTLRARSRPRSRLPRSGIISPARRRSELGRADRTRPVIEAPAPQYETRPCSACGPQTVDALASRRKKVRQGRRKVCSEGAQVTKAGLLRFHTTLFVDPIADWCVAQIAEDLEEFAR